MTRARVRPGPYSLPPRILAARQPAKPRGTFDMVRADRIASIRPAGRLARGRSSAPALPCGRRAIRSREDFPAARRSRFVGRGIRGVARVRFVGPPQFGAVKLWLNGGAAFGRAGEARWASAIVRRAIRYLQVSNSLRPMQYAVSADPGRVLPPIAATRFARLGFDATVTRQGVVEECGSPRAGDQFIHTWSRRGLLVPAAWGSYYVPPERVVALALAARGVHHARLVSWAATPPGKLGVPRRPAFIGPVLWRHTNLSAASPAPTLPLLPREPRIPATAPQLQAFAADLGWPLEPLEIVVEDLGKVSAKNVSLPDVAWILSLNMDPRIRAAGDGLLTTMPPRDRARARDIRRLANFAALAPTGPRGLRPMVGPPGQYRLFAPRWYMVPHLRALQSEARRNPRA